MGIQVSFKFADALNAGIVEGVSREDNEIWIEYTVGLRHGDKVFLVSMDSSGYCWCDANHWGRNREIIVPLLTKHKIHFMEG